jgi:hypothetical protein
MTCSKFAYPSKKDAVSQINFRTRGRSQYRHGRPEALRAYHCPHCNGWHITHTDIRPKRYEKKKQGPTRR